MFIGIILILLTLFLSKYLPKKLRFFYCLGIFIRISVAILNTNIGLPGGRGDALRFFRLSLSIKDYFDYYNLYEKSGLKSLIIGTKTYVYFHHFLQKISIIPSFFASHCLSILISGISILFIIKTYFLLNNSTLKGARSILIIYSLCPTLITNQTFVLRECFQTLVITMLIFCPIYMRYLREKVGIKSKYYITTTIYIFSILFSLTLHQIFLVVTPFILITTLVFEKKLVSIFEIKKIFNLKPSKRWFISFMILGLIFIGIFNISRNVDWVEKLITVTPLENAKEYQERQYATEDAFANYENDIDINNPLTIIKPFFLYLFSPLGMSYRINDLIIYPEKLLIFWFLLNIIAKLNKINLKDRSYILNMLSIWLCINLIFSLGTWNWGTSNRHLVISFALILIPYIYVTNNLKFSMRKDIISKTNNNFSLTEFE